MIEKLNSQLQSAKSKIKSLEKKVEILISTMNQTHVKIEVGDEQLFNMLKEQQKTINALIQILNIKGINIGESEIKDTINAKEVMDGLLKTQPTESEINQYLREEANRLYKLLYREHGYMDSFRKEEDI